jgi:hypothetical protein
MIIWFSHCLVLWISVGFVIEDTIYKRLLILWLRQNCIWKAIERSSKIGVGQTTSPPFVSLLLHTPYLYDSSSSDILALFGCNLSFDLVKYALVASPCGDMA